MDEAAPPAALEEDVKGRARDARDAPALLRHDRPQEALGERHVGRRDDVAQAGEQPRLVGGRDAGLEEPVTDDESAHAGRAADVAQPGVADDGVDRVRGVVVGAADHRREPGAGGALRLRMRA